MRRVWTAAAGILTVALVACGGGTDEAADEMLPDTTATATPPAATPPPAGGTAQLPEGVTAEMVAAGQAIFTGAGNCFTCHADDGSGTALAPNLRDSEWINLTEGSIEEIVQLVHTGVPTPKEHPAPMPPMGGAQLTEEQIQQVASYVYTLSHGG